MQRRRKTKLGRVVSNKMNKTAVVTVETFRHHPIYGKTVRTVLRYKAHDENNECGPGDTVRLEETRPLSKEKRWRVTEIVTRAEVVEIRPGELETELAELESQPEAEDVGTEGEIEETSEEESAE